MVVNVKRIFAQVKGTNRVTLNERQENKYHFFDFYVPSMHEEILKANLIWLPKISHPLEKCFVLKNRIMQLHKEEKNVFEEEVASSNLTLPTMVSQFNMMDRTIKFGSFNPITLASSKVGRWISKGLEALFYFQNIEMVVIKLQSHIKEANKKQRS
ncbi:hypothetical protein ERO13_D04G067475v2 [Gossypium hirsutum]|uniref:Uncharacterized protein n=2 Tax=Gossypium TaxID=3633 RepID=A0A5J5RT11_GOSBA|nr:hypothetical protein ES319_D04G076200v1 [Gossypium barbadense]KAG4151487.1 hypothetical protein ERO13_D04G067475v2 [Gossypium hirsutum]TYH76368.1 hypothetical protein ES332_D04G080900v1 [Gossypium tomentosum]